MRSRHGFTLVELLVVIAIVAILVGLLIPAVQSAREAGRRITCANHLKQVGLSALHYADANTGRLPGAVHKFYARNGRPWNPAGANAANCGYSRPNSLGWRVALLPFLEEESLFDQFDFREAALSETNVGASTAILPVFQCPSTPGYPRTINLVDVNVVPLEPQVKAGAYDYFISYSPVFVYIGGRDGLHLPAWNGFARLREDTDEMLRERGQCPSAVALGPARLKWVTDGLSKTTVLFERAWTPNVAVRHSRGLPIYDDEGNRLTVPFYIQSKTNGAFGWARPSGISGGAGQFINANNHGAGRFAFHPGGVNNAMLDGSIHFLNESIWYGVLGELDTRAGGEPVHVQALQ